MIHKKGFLISLLLLSQIVVLSQNNFIANQVIVMLNGNYSIGEVVQQYNGTKPDKTIDATQVLSKRAHIYLISFDSNQTSVPSVISQLKMDERVVYAQPNHNNVKRRSTIPNDLEYPVQWSVGSSATARIFAPEAWDITTDGITENGDTIVMAVVDGGVDIDHIDLNMFKNRHEIPNNGLDDDHNGYVDDYDGWNAYTQSGNINSDSHGTHIAGTMGAKTNNNEGVAGIVWGGKILPINASSNVESVVIEGYGYALELRSTYNRTNGDSGAFIVATNSSFGIDYGQPADYPIWCAFYDSLGASGILNLAATSNASLNVDVTGDVPTTCPSNYMIAVSNIDRNGNISGGYGATQIDLAAPGTDIRSTTPGHNYGFKTGTSMATPHVAGVVGAMYSAMCGFDQSVFLTEGDSIALWVRSSLLESVDSVPNLIGKNITNGRLNMLKAVQSMASVNVNSTLTNVLPTSNNSFDGEVISSTTGGTLPYSYVWSNGSTNSNITQVGPGTYSVVITEKYGCQQTDSTDLWTVGITDLVETDQLIIAPNPNNGSFTITSNNFKQGDQLSIFNNTGQLVYTIEISAVSTIIDTQLNSGLYFIRIGNTDFHKVIIE